MTRLSLTVLLALTWQGCTQFAPPPAAPPPPQQYQRFIPAATADRDFALDTKSGKLCKTWNWTITDSPLNALPECADLRSEDPD